MPIFLKNTVKEQMLVGVEGSSFQSTTDRATSRLVTCGTLDRTETSVSLNSDASSTHTKMVAAIGDMI